MSQLVPKHVKEKSLFLENEIDDKVNNGACNEPEQAVLEQLYVRAYGKAPQQFPEFNGSRYGQYPEYDG